MEKAVYRSSHLLGAGLAFPILIAAGLASWIPAAAASTGGNDIVLLQSTDPSIVGAGAGNDTYIMTPYQLTTGTQILTISDTQGNNLLQLAEGLSIAKSEVAATSLRLTLSNGAQFTVLGADAFQYDAGGNAAAGVNHTPVSFATFVQNTLLVTVPATGIATGGSVIITNCTSSCKSNQWIGTISFNPATLSVNGTTTVSATATSGLPVSFSSTTSSICGTGGTNGSTVTGKAAGTCTIAGNQAGDSNYNPASQVTQSVTVTSSSMPSLAVSDVTVSEGAGTASVPVSLSVASNSTVTASFGTSDGTATAGSDYTAKSGTLTFDPGVTSKNIVVTILEDTVAESNETINVNLTTATGATIGRKTGVITITDNDSSGSAMVWDVGVWDQGLWN
ncbi:hypothetical protein CCP4SC76_7610003 [Gammaproteobacteria bacterium]